MKRYKLLDPCCNTGEFFKKAIDLGYCKVNEVFAMCRSDLAAKATSYTLYGDINYKKHKNIIIMFAEKPEEWSYNIKNMHFDKVIMNPPYNRSLHLKILDEVCKHSENIISLQPVRWLQDPVAIYKNNSAYYKYENISKRIKDIELIPTRDASKLFNIELLFPLGIYKIDSNGGYNYQHNEWYQKIFKKCFDENNLTKLDVKKYNDTLTNYVCLNKMAPSMKYGNPMLYAVKNIGWFNGDKNYREVKKTLRGATRGDVEDTDCVVFATEEEVKNCYNAFMTIFCKFVCAISVCDVNVVQRFLPWMSDYTQPWTNERFCNYFGITGFISDTEAQPGSEWAEILNTMKEYIYGG